MIIGMRTGSGSWPRNYSANETTNIQPFAERVVADMKKRVQKCVMNTSLYGSVLAGINVL